MTTIKVNAPRAVTDPTSPCPECQGLRHGSQCVCRGEVQDLMGCCTTCNGNGYTIKGRKVDSLARVGKPSTPSVRISH